MLEKNKVVKTSFLLKKEQKFISLFLINLSVVSFTGFITWFFQEHTAWQQFTYLLHTFIGFFLLFIFLIFLILHVRLALGFKRPGQALVGWLSVLVFITSDV